MDKLTYYDKLADAFEAAYGGGEKEREEGRRRINEMCRKDLHL